MNDGCGLSISTTDIVVVGSNFTGGYAFSGLCSLCTRGFGSTSSGRRLSLPHCYPGAHKRGCAGVGGRTVVFESVCVAGLSVVAPSPAPVACSWESTSSPGLCLRVPGVLLLL